ncbi:asparagine synthase (glutamine-hydrolyzing) [Lutispora saccharofermentans]|uniref:asparagine synthase (glutamine-hydrolyzing) n=1 Tax=Lutispora saccharofermentans TaxID=3024236 RepID=A0ABT1NDE7_9FIRM|nr:asparagine synthase (glutamine-hydrolyzing) [Lutispora saccharofermentans]MCQ1529166.1 asparagine synthase (glutamine-hydrolyzing) [Lutispora saccharofermentans]
MCGICGMIGKKDEEVIERMINKLKHRGPDGSGKYFDEDMVGLGHVRLSIIDLSLDAQQPMVSQDGRYAIVYNGEIFNYKELRSDLESLGYTFKSDSDTEVLLNAYIEWKEGFLSKLNGMFSFAIWDSCDKVLFCARDRLGVKPFYYFKDDEVFVFASEIKAILEYMKYKVKPDDEVIYEYLINGYVDYDDKTFFSGVYKLKPGHYATVSYDKKIDMIKYWDIDSIREENAMNYADCKNKLSKLFKSSVELRLRSDVPIGSCLSGGIDSSSIVCTMSDILEGSVVNTFSSCSEDKAYDERKYIEEVLRRQNINGNYLFPDSSGLIKDIYNLVYHQEEPFLSTSVFAQWCLMRKAKDEGVKVILDGQGADEIFGGYRKYRLYYIKELYTQRNFSEILIQIIKGIDQTNLSYNAKADLNKIKKIFGLKSNNAGILNYYNSDFISSCSSQKISMISPKSLEEAMYMDLTRTSLPALLRYEDKNSMAFSIETRLPFLDYRIVEFAKQIPNKYKLQHGWSKSILRDVMKGTLPDSIRLRKDKMGFATAEKTWLLEQAAFFRSIFNQEEFLSSKYINPSLVYKDFYDIINSNNYNHLWRWISLELWMRCFFNGVDQHEKIMDF